MLHDLCLPSPGLSQLCVYHLLMAAYAHHLIPGKPSCACITLSPLAKVTLRSHSTGQMVPALPGRQGQIDRWAGRSFSPDNPRAKKPLRIQPARIDVDNPNAQCYEGPSQRLGKGPRGVTSTAPGSAHPACVPQQGISCPQEDSAARA